MNKEFEMKNMNEDVNCQHQFDRNKLDDFKEVIVHHQQHDERLLQYLNGIHEYGIKSTRKMHILIYIFVILLYFAIQIGMIIMNTKPQEYIGKIKFKLKLYFLSKKI